MIVTRVSIIIIIIVTALTFPNCLKSTDCGLAGYAGSGVLRAYWKDCLANTNIPLILSNSLWTVWRGYRVSN